MSTTGYDALYETLKANAIGVANVLLLPLQRCCGSPLFNHPCSLTSTDPLLQVLLFVLD
ncbi:hypothetical protein [Nostoc sp.]|uniref:hypothetical protein n=1 Tax=Nostoc sp. TaxID=1180 RepID=UPI002FF8D9F9